LLPPPLFLPYFPIGSSLMCPPPFSSSPPRTQDPSRANYSFFQGNGPENCHEVFVLPFSVRLLSLFLRLPLSWHDLSQQFFGLAVRPDSPQVSFPACFYSIPVCASKPLFVFSRALSLYSSRVLPPIFSYVFFFSPLQDHIALIKFPAVLLSYYQYVGGLNSLEARFFLPPSAPFLLTCAFF